MAAELVLTEVWDEALAFLLLLKRLVTVIYYFPQAKQLRDFTGGRNAPLRLKVSQKQTQWSVDSKKWRFFHGWSWWSLCVCGGGGLQPSPVAQESAQCETCGRSKTMLLRNAASTQTAKSWETFFHRRSWKPTSQTFKEDESSTSL